MYNQQLEATSGQYHMQKRGSTAGSPSQGGGASSGGNGDTATNRSRSQTNSIDRNSRLRTALPDNLSQHNNSDTLSMVMVGHQTLAANSPQDLRDFQKKLINLPTFTISDEHAASICLLPNAISNSSLNRKGGRGSKSSTPGNSEVDLVAKQQQQQHLQDLDRMLGSSGDMTVAGTGRRNRRSSGTDSMFSKLVKNSSSFKRKNSSSLDKPLLVPPPLTTTTTTSTSTKVLNLTSTRAMQASVSSEIVRGRSSVTSGSSHNNNNNRIGNNSNENGDRAQASRKSTTDISAKGAIAVADASSAMRASLKTTTMTTTTTVTILNKRLDPSFLVAHNSSNSNKVKFKSNKNRIFEMLITHTIFISKF
jgi:hypothetical protein